MRINFDKLFTLLDRSGEREREQERETSKTSFILMESVDFPTERTVKRGIYEISLMVIERINFLFA